MNAENQYLISVQLSHAAERIYKVAYLLPPPESMEQLPSSFSIKLPVPTVIQNACLMVNIFKTIPYSHKAFYMDKLQPKLQTLVHVWLTLPTFTTLKQLQQKPFELKILREVAKGIHEFYPTAGIPGERISHPGFSLTKSADPLVLSNTSALNQKVVQAAVHCRIFWPKTIGNSTLEKNN